MRKLLAPALSVLLAGCMAPPKRVDDLGVPPAAPELSLVVVPTENTRNMIEFNRLHNRATNPFDPVAQLAKEQPMNTLISSLIYNFKSVVKVDSLNQAKTVDADLIGMLDYYFVFQPIQVHFMKDPTPGRMHVDEAMVMLDRSGRQVAKVSVSADKVLNPPTFGWILSHPGVNGYALHFNEIQDEIMEKFTRALAGDEDLRKFRPAAAPGAVVAAAPAKKTFRSDVDAPRYKKEEDPSRYALVVGVEDYQSLPSAEFAERDAKAVRDHLIALGTPERNVVLLTGREAGKAGLEKYLESWLPRNVDEKSRVFVYFAGHGAPDPKTGDAYLMPWDADAKFIDTTAYPVKKLYAGLASLKAGKVLLAMDAGFSGTGGRSVLPKGARPLVTGVDAGMPASDRLLVMTAASGGESVGTAKDEGHGLFTYQMLKTLSDADGAGTVKELFDGLRAKVRDAARREDRDQTPRLLPAAGGKDRTP